MKKEKTIRTYQRRTKTGKVVTVKQHTAKYDAAEALKEAAKKKGAGDELENLKKGKPEKVKVEKPAEDTPDYGFTAEEYKAWYHWDQDADPKNKSALKVEKALKKQMGTKAYSKYFDEMSDNYSARGHNKGFKGLSGKFSTDTPTKSISGKEAKTSKGGFDNEKSFSQNFPKELRQYIDSRNFSLKKKPTKSVERAFKDAGFEIHHNDVEGIWEPTRNGMRYKETDWSAKNKAERDEKPNVVKWAKDNGYSLRRDGMFQLKADAKKSRHEIYTLKDLEAKTGKDYSAKVKEAHAALKEKGYKRYTYNGKVYYATKSGSLKQVDEKGKVQSVVPFKGAKGTQEMALKGRKRSDAEKARAKRDKEDAKKYRENLKSEGSKSKSSDVDKAPKSSKSKTQIWGKSESAAIKMFDKYVAKNGYPGDGKPSMKILGQYLRQTLKKNKYGTDKEIEKKVKEYLG